MHCTNETLLKTFDPGQIFANINEARGRVIEER